MQLPKKQARTVTQALEHWRQAGLLDSVTAQRLLSDVEPMPFDWRRLAKYSFWAAIACLVTSVSAVLADKVLRELLQRIFHAPHAVKCLALAAVAGGFYTWGIRRRATHPEKIYSTQALLFLGVLSTAASIFELGEAIDTSSGHFSLLLLLGCFVYAGLGWIFRSGLIWVFALISLGSWFGAETGYTSGWGAYYLGMNYPLRFVVFGAVLTGAALALEKQPRFEPFHRETLAMGLLYLFVALWILSIFGNYGDMHQWQAVKQIELFHWSLIFGLVAAGAIYHGLREDSGLTKGFGLTFLFINLYTRFFEYFWNSLHQALFFAALAASFWWLGAKAETIWNLGKQRNR